MGGTYFMLLQLRTCIIQTSFMWRTLRSQICHKKWQNTLISSLSIGVLKGLNWFPSRHAQRPDMALNKALLILTLCYLICTRSISVWFSWYHKLKELSCSSLLNLNYIELLSVNMQLRQCSPLQAMYQCIKSWLKNLHRKCTFMKHIFMRYSKNHKIVNSVANKFSYCS